MFPTAPRQQQQQEYYSTDMYGQLLLNTSVKNPPILHNPEQRTVYLSSIPNHLSVSDIMDQVKYGPIQAIRPLPEKNGLFITFIDSITAFEFYQQINNTKLHDIKIGWGKPSNLTTNISNALQNGASRNVYLGLLNESITEDEIRQDLSRFGHIEHIKIIPDKKIAFIHFLCISNAVKCVNSLQTESKWQTKRINFGKDRCQQTTIQPQQKLFILPSLHQQHYPTPATRYATIDPYHHIPQQQQQQQQQQQSQFGGIANRTIYLGNIHPDTTLEDICNSIRGGILSQIRFIPDKHIAFITFVDPLLAENFMNSTECLVIKNRRLKIGWGKPSSLPLTILNVIQNGGSRNVYIGNIDDQITEEKLKHDFSEYGDIELVNTLKEKNCAFVNFTSIAGAVRAIEGIRSKEEYKKFRINYGKDRCGNPPRFNYNNNNNQQFIHNFTNNNNNYTNEEDEEEEHLMSNTTTTTNTTANTSNITTPISTSTKIITSPSSSPVVVD